MPKVEQATAYQITNLIKTTTLHYPINVIDNHLQFRHTKKRDNNKILATQNHIRKKHRNVPFNT